MMRHHLPRSRRALAVAMALALLPATQAFAQESTAANAGSDPPVAPRTPADLRPPAQLAVSPARFEIDMNEGATVHAARLMNFGDREVIVKVSVLPWELDEHNRVVTLPPGENTLDQAMVFNPSEFVVPPRSEQTVRFSIRPRTRPADGEHRAMIYFQEQPGPEAPKGLQVLFRVGVAVYAYAGDVSRRGELQQVQVASDAQVLRAAFNVASTGNAHVRMAGQYAVWPVDRFPGLEGLAPFEGIDQPDFRAPEPVLLAGLLPALPVLGGTTRQLLLASEHGLAPGPYVLSLLGTVGEQPIRQAIEFVVPARKPDAAIGRQDDDSTDS